jgi:protein-arginine kinase activator protein McsA
MNLSPWEKWIKNIKNSPIAFLDPSTNYATKEEQISRLNICNSCEFFFKPIKQCKKCGCVMSAKTTLKNAFCPIGKW